MLVFPPSDQVGEREMASAELVDFGFNCQVQINFTAIGSMKVKRFLFNSASRCHDCLVIPSDIDIAVINRCVKKVTFLLKIIPNNNTVYITPKTKKYYFSFYFIYFFLTSFHFFGLFHHIKKLLGLEKKFYM